MSYSIPTLRGYLNKGSGTSGAGYNYNPFCNSFGVGSQPSYFLLNGSPPSGISLETPVDVTFLYTADLAQLVADYPSVTVGYEWSRAGPVCPNISGGGSLTSNTVVTITNPCEDSQTVSLSIKVYNASGWLDGVCCIPYGLLCTYRYSSFIAATYNFDIDPAPA